MFINIFFVVVVILFKEIKLRRKTHVSVREACCSGGHHASSNAAMNSGGRSRRDGCEECDALDPPADIIL